MSVLLLNDKYAKLYKIDLYEKSKKKNEKKNKTFMWGRLHSFGVCEPQSSFLFTALWDENTLSYL